MNSATLIGARKTFCQQALIFFIYVFTAAGVATLVWCAGSLAQSRHKQAVAIRNFRIEKTASALVKGSAFAVLKIPRLHLLQAVIEGADDTQLRLAPGHVTGTALPGEGSNTAIAGHRDSFFRPLKDIRIGDEIVVNTPAREIFYRVTNTEIVDPSDTRVLRASHEEKLTLITCYPFYYVGAAPKRFIVHASRVD
jgi:sortase A